MSPLHILLVNGLHLQTIHNYSRLAMISPAFPSAPTMSGKGAGPTTEARIPGHPMNQGHTQGTHYASILMFGATCAIMHSKTTICLPITPPTTFWERLDSYGNYSLWENLSYNGDRE
jgi:hypothetical protein